MEDKMIGKGEKKEIDIAEIWGVFLKRKWIIISAAAIVIIVAGIISFTQTPLYRSTTTVLIEEPSSGMLNLQDMFNPYYRSNYIGTYFNTQLKLLQSRSLAERVARKMNLASRSELRTMGTARKNPLLMVKDFLSFRWIIPSWIKPKRPGGEGAPSSSWTPQDPNSMLASMIQGGLIVIPVEETRIVEVSYVSPSPVLAADVVNALAEEFISYSIETRYEATQQASEFLVEQIAQLREELSTKEKELQKYGEDKKILFLNEKESTVVSKFADLSTAYNQAQIDRVNKEASYRELRSLDINSLPQFVNNSMIQSLKTSYSQKKSEYEEKSRIFKSSHPEMIKLRASLDSMKSELEIEINKAVEAAESEYRTAQGREASLKSLLDEQREDVVQMNNNAILYNSLKIEVENKRVLLNSLVSKQNETLVSARLEGLKTSNIKIIDKALIPGGPFSPNTRRALMMALLFGLFGGLGLAFLIEYLDNTVKNPEELEKLTGLPSLGVIPFISQDGIKKKSAYYSSYSYSYGRKTPGKEDIPQIKEIELINHLHPEFAISEDYRTIRTSILFSHAENPPQVISFSSSLPQEGKTATVANIAISFAQLENKVLIIDGDMRRPRLHKIFKARNLVGLSSYLTGKASFEEAIQKTDIENIWILPSGPHPPNPAELLNSKKMKELINDARETFSSVLIDTPPVLAVIDPIVISSLSDCTVLVTKAGKTNRKSLISAIAEIRKSNAQIIGVVFNEMKIKKDGYYSPHYDSYQDEYYEDMGQ
jgi:succinoglycan biosynthesis transport protein ExoP